MQQPATILAEGTKIRTHNAIPFRVPWSGVRRCNTTGTIEGVLGGMGGDVYQVRHEDGMVGGYCWDEFELADERGLSRKFDATPEQLRTNPLLKAARVSGMTEEQVVELLTKENAELKTRLFDALAKASPREVVLLAEQRLRE